MIDYVIFGIIIGIGIRLLIYFIARTKKKDITDEPMDSISPDTD
jgi:hypothetical protein